MPVANDLTPEEEQMFSQHGVAPAGPGMEPNGEPSQPAPAAPAAEPAPAAPAAAPAQPRDAKGQFAPKTQQEQEAAAAAGQQPGTPPAAPEAPPTMVPHAALHEARERERQARQQLAALQARTNAILAANAQRAATTTPQMPNIEEDPVGYMQALEKRLNDFEATRQRDTAYREIDMALEQDEQMFASYTPDYEQASDYYVQSRARELLALHSPEQAQNILLAETRQLAQEAWRRGMPAAQMVYQLAQARGYAGPQAQPVVPPAAPAPAVPQAQQPTLQTNFAQPLTAQQQVAAAQMAAQQSKSLSVANSSGTSPADALNANDLLNMSDEEFERYLALGTKGANARFAAIQ